MQVPAGHSFPDATGVAFTLGLGPPSRLAAIFIIILTLCGLSNSYLCDQK